MECKYRGEEMIRTQHYPKAFDDVYDFEESVFECPNCSSECSYGEPWGYDWTLGNINNIQYKIEFNKNDLMEYKKKVDSKGIAIHFKRGITLGHYGILGWVLNNRKHKIAQSKDWKKFKEMVESAI